MSDRVKILVVDDDPGILELASAVLASGGYDVIEATTGKDALEAVAKAHPDLVVLDVVLPDMSGSRYESRSRPTPTCEVPSWLSSQAQHLKPGADDRA